MCHGVAAGGMVAEWAGGGGRGEEATMKGGWILCEYFILKKKRGVRCNNSSH